MADRERLGVFSVHGISRYDSMAMAQSVKDGVLSWLTARFGLDWESGFEEEHVGKRRPKQLARLLLVSDSDGPDFVFSESNWSEITKGQFRAYNMWRWIENLVNSAGQAFRSLNRKTAIELWFSLAPLIVGLSFLGVATLISEKFASHGLLSSLPGFFLIGQGVVAMAEAIARPFVPGFVGSFQFLGFALKVYSRLPPRVRSLFAILETIRASQVRDPLNLVLVLWSVFSGTFRAAFWFASAALYTLAFSSVDVFRIAAFLLNWLDCYIILGLSIAICKCVTVIRSIWRAYEPLEDIFAYGSAGQAAKVARREAVNRVSCDLRNFLASGVDTVVLLGHSLGSMLLLEALGEIHRDVESGRFAVENVLKIKSVAIYGSPYTKILSIIWSRKPREFSAERRRVSLAFGLIAELSKMSSRACLHNFYYLTDVVSEKICGLDSFLLNHRLPTPIQFWSHSAYHRDPNFWDSVLGRFVSKANMKIEQVDKFAISPIIPEPSNRQILLGMTKVVSLFACMGFSVVLLRYGLSPVASMVFILLSMVCLELTIRD